MKKIGFVFISIFIITCFSCKFISSFSEDPVVELSFDKPSLTIDIGEMDIVNLSISSKSKQSDITIIWEYDDSVIMARTDNYSAVFTALKSGTTTLKAFCGDSSVSCLITVTDSTYSVPIINPYVYASSDYIQIKPNETQKISASLFGGTQSDVNGYTWSIDKPSVASLSTEGNYCWITGVNDGFAKLTVKHNKASFGYSVLINCSSDGKVVSYITTNENIITINKSEVNTADFAVDLMNPLVADYASGFTFSVVDELGNEIKDSLVITGSNGQNVSVAAYETGNYYVRCSHPNAMYYLDILVRVIENVEVSYIEPSATQITINGNETQSVSVSLANYTGTIDNDLFSWSFSTNAEKYISYEIFNGSSENTGNNIFIKGLKNGSCKITISYPNMSDRSIIVIIRNVETEAASAKTYITTSQNMIKMGLDDDAKTISISLTEGQNCDINQLNWSIVNTASDGSSKDVIKWVVGTGTHTSTSTVKSRGVIIPEKFSATATIQALNPGTAYIDISHPNAIYKTRVTVIVTEGSSEKKLSSTLSLTENPNVYIRNGESSSVSVIFSGDGSTEDIKWKSSNPLITLAPAGNKCEVIAPIAESGVNKSTITATHPNFEYSISFNILCYDTAEEKQENVIKSIFTYNPKVDLYIEETYSFSVEKNGIPDSQIINWEIVQGSSFIDLQIFEDTCKATVIANKIGQAIIKASSLDCNDLFFYVNIKDKNIINEQDVCYLSTPNNVVYFEDINVSKNIIINPYNINETCYSDIVYSCDSTSFEISANNNVATITSLSSNAKGVLTVTHPLSQNSLIINLHCGEQFEYINEDFCYISTDKDSLDLYTGQDEVQLTATLNHTEKSDLTGIAKGFTFKSENPDIAEVSYATYSNFCFIKPLKNGVTKIIITHPESNLDKEVVVVVNNAPDITNIPYISTSDNVITMIQGDYASASVVLKNSDSIDSSKWSWVSSDSRICDIVANNGTTSMISANKPGTTQLIVKHEDCIYSLKIIVVVIDSSVITSKPYIESSENIINIKKGSSANLSAKMIGDDSEEVNNYFRFNGSNSGIILVTGSSDTAFIKALDTGMAYITISNSKYPDSYSKTVLVIVEDTPEDSIYIKPSNTIVKLKPTNTSLTMLSAELVGGEKTDGENFIWWCDDPNLVVLTSVADQCSIVPTGKSGTTKINIKHEKSLKSCEILVLISEHETFSFGSSSATINSDKIFFVPMNLPVIEDDFEVVYSSSNTDVCVIQGSKNIAWLCGVNYGTASLTAKMISTKDKLEIASCEMLVYVNVPDPKLPVVTLGDSILNVDIGTSKTLFASISGENIEESEKYNLLWEWKTAGSTVHQGNNITFLGQSKGYGPEVYVSFNKSGEYVLTVTHPQTKATSSMTIKVEEKGTLSIELNTYLESIYKDDGSITLTANIINGSESDYKNLEWSAVKVNGQNIVSVSKAKGKSCTVTPRAVGQANVIARLPSGQTAQCVIIVKAATELIFDVGTLHVIPGYTEVINYQTIPANATINWIAQGVNFSEPSEYFTFSDDPANKQLRVTAHKHYGNSPAGTITGYAMGASSANLPSVKIVTEYNLELSIIDSSNNKLTLLNNTNPDTNNVKTFKIKYYPDNLNIDILSDNTKLVEAKQDSLKTPNYINLFSVGQYTTEKIVEGGLTKVIATVSFIPHGEGSSTISVKAYIPDNSSYYKTDTFIYNAFYSQYQFEFDWESSVGAFSRESNNNFYIGDGEEILFNVKIKNENASGSIDGFEWSVPSDCPQSRAKEVDLVPNSSSNIKSDSRTLTKAKEVFGDTNISKISENVNKNPKKGVISVTQEGSSFRIKHNWDFYKDLPTEVDTKDKWDQYKKDNVYKEDFISNLNNNGVDYWLVEKDMYSDLQYYNGSYYFTNRYFFMSHPSTTKNYTYTNLNQTYPNGTICSIASVDWEKNIQTWDDSDGSENRHFQESLSMITNSSTKRILYYYDKIWDEAKGSDKEWKKRSILDQDKNPTDRKVGAGGVYSLDDMISIGAKDNYEYENKLDYYSCDPYVISTSLLLNKAYVRPDKDKNNVDISSVSKRVTTEDGFWDWWAGMSRGEVLYEHIINLPKLIHEHVSPTTNKDPSVQGDNGKAIFKIKYKDGHGDVKTTVANGSNEIIVYFEKRICEAYTNNSWDKYTSSPNDVRYYLK